ncbi:hypothetical protein CUMW_143720 [Citrus unshiu]|uniref:Protein kinase domain-containing protein n=1 Tax=Citrus unshiu TaxID=55188 RepID=A0A2H5PK02_CITUN|nr:hypothetical protein CUMW_143720 [Citrus unshiu]
MCAGTCTFSRLLWHHKKVPTPVKPEVQKAAPPIEVPALPLDELKEKTDNFGSKALIGEGSYGRVYYANLENGKAVAVKKLDVSFEPESNVEFLTQVSVVSRLKHENLVELLGSTTKSSVDWMTRVRIAVDAARGLEYLHEKVQLSIIHRDIRSSNIYLLVWFGMLLGMWLELECYWKMVGCWVWVGVLLSVCIGVLERGCWSIPTGRGHYCWKSSLKSCYWNISINL